MPGNEYNLEELNKEEAELDRNHDEFVVSVKSIIKRNTIFFWINMTLILLQGMNIGFIAARVIELHKKISTSSAFLSVMVILLVAWNTWNTTEAIIKGRESLAKEGVLYTEIKRRIDLNRKDLLNQYFQGE